MKKHLALLILVGLSWGASVGTGQEVIEEIVAVINDEIITLSRAREQYQAVLQQLQAEQLSTEQYEEQRQRLKNELLEAMITDILLLQKARELDLNITEQLRSSIENIKKEYNLASDDDLRRALQQQGITYEDWYKQYEETLLRQAVIFSEVERGIVLEDAEIVQYYKQHPDEFTVPAEYQLRAVYFSQEGKNPSELAALKGTVDERIRAGEELRALAARYSDSPLNETEGDLGRFKLAELDKSLGEVVEKLNVGEISPWIEARAGWYLIKLEEKADSFLQPFEDIKESVQQRLFNTKRAEKLEVYLKDIRERSYIRILNPNPWDY